MFYGRTINKQPIPVKKRIYVLEDIDAAGLEDVVKRRGEEMKEEEVASTREESPDSETWPKKDESNPSPQFYPNLLPQTKANATLTLADLLEVFDGVMEMRVKSHSLKAMK